MGDKHSQKIFAAGRSGQGKYSGRAFFETKGLWHALKNGAQCAIRVGGSLSVHPAVIAPGTSAWASGVELAERVASTKARCAGQLGFTWVFHCITGLRWAISKPLRYASKKCTLEFGNY
ncbi:hypothetical protein ACFFV8_07155 [Sphingobium indicum]|uniref:hypothetical protein n=1 Tax=Sphingobium TaxID=165695 RepID=UPI000F685B4D|nr:MULTISPECIES: hypothetical protein [Sphingobium]